MALPSWMIEVTMFLCLIAVVIAVGIAVMLQGQIYHGNVSEYLGAILAALQVRSREGRIPMTSTPVLGSPDGGQSPAVEIRRAPGTSVPPSTERTQSSDGDSVDYIEMQELYDVPRQPAVRMAETEV